jgi:hypothetical protein
MKRKLIILLALTVATVGITACGKTETTETEPTEVVEEAEENEIETEVELEYAVPEYDIDGTVSLLPWTELGKLDTHPELRAAFDEMLYIYTNEEGTKDGIFYTNANHTEYDIQNNTLLNVILNTNFIDRYTYGEANVSRIEDIAKSEYTDLEDDQGVAAVVNAYFELLPDAEKGKFNGNATISKAQAMTLVMRATTLVNEAQAPETDTDFTSAVGSNEYTNFAAPMNEYAYVNTSNGLNEKTFNEVMTKAEYICLLTAYIQANVDTDSIAIGDAAELSTVANAGDVTLSSAVADAVNGVPSDMYQILVDAVNLGLIEESDLEDWDLAITKSDAITMLMSTLRNLFPKGHDMDGDGIIDGYDAVAGPGKYTGEQLAAGWDYADEMGKKYKEETGTTDGYAEAYDAYAESQGADNAYGAYFIYYNGKAAGSESSYMIDQRDGTRYELGDEVPGYGYFYGTHDEFDEASLKVYINQGATIEYDEDGNVTNIITH